MNTGKRIANFQSVINDNQTLKKLNHLNKPGSFPCETIMTDDKLERIPGLSLAERGMVAKYEHDEINSFGYRGPEFKNGNRVLYLGCSQTWGVSIREEHLLWPSLLNKKTNLTYSNIAVPGNSVQSQIIKAFQYFKEFGNPEIIIGMFPFARFEFPYIGDKIIFKTLQPSVYLSENPNIYFGDVHVPYDLNKDDKRNTFTKTPHDMIEIFPIEVALYYNNIFISMLEQYCESNNIKFLWSFWEAVDPIADNLLKEKYKSYFSFPLEMHNNIPKTLKDEYFQSLVNEYEAKDHFSVAPDGCHFGIGKHIVIADEIYYNLNI